MKKTIGLSATTVLIMAAGTAVAVPRDYKGSDTLELFTRTLITQCGLIDGGVRYPSLFGTPDYRYIGGGSGNGGTGLRNGVQDVAPMSRALSVAEGCEAVVEAQADENLQAVNFTTGGMHVGEQAEQWIIGLDGMVVVTRAQNQQRCLQEVAPGASDGNIPNNVSIAYNSQATFPIFPRGDNSVASTGTYSVQNWRDLLRVLYAGADNVRAVSAGGTDINGNGNQQNAGNRVARCNSDIRRSLVNDYDNIVQKLAGVTDCGTLAQSCQVTLNIPDQFFPSRGGLRHLVRRDDLSGTTDTFLTLLGLNGVGGVLPVVNGNTDIPTLGVNEPFCNGRDFQDKDPIRINNTAINPSPTNCTAVGAPVAGAALNDETGGPGERIVGVVGQLNIPQPSFECSGTGLVNPMTVSTLVGTTNGVPTTANTAGLTGNRREPRIEELYPTRNCVHGRFELRQAPRSFEINFGTCGDFTPTAVPGRTFFGLPDCRNVNFDVACYDPRCPDGSRLSGGACPTPVASATSPGEAYDSYCVNSRSNSPPGSPDLVPGGAKQNDGRVFNRLIRAMPGSGFPTVSDLGPILRNERGRDAQFAEFRMKVRQITHANNTPECPYTESVQTCRELDSTRAIGCLSRTSECTVGFAGREAFLISGGIPFELGNLNLSKANPSTAGVDPTDDSIRAFDYKLARKLYYNTLTGFDNIAGTGKLGTARVEKQEPPPGGLLRPEQRELSTCLTEGGVEEEAAVQAALTASGFLKFDLALPAAQCEDFNDFACLPAGTLPCVTNADCTTPSLPVCGDGFCRPFADKDACTN